jgi:hypothetical protein
MKSYKDYLIESKTTYDFKVKIAGDCPKDCTMLIKRGLSKFQVENCSSGKSTPIQETQADFPSLKNVGVTMFDVSTSYPATSAEIAALIAEHTGVSLGSIKVRNEKELAEEELNHANDEASGESLLEKPEMEAEDGQKLVGDKHVMSMLKELGKAKKELTQYKGVNEKILAKKAPSEKADKQKVTTNSKSPVGSRKVTLPTVGGQ